MRKLRSYNFNQDLILNRFRETLNIQKQVENAGLNTDSINTPEKHLKLNPNPQIGLIKISGLKEGEVMQAKWKSNRNVFFFHFVFFTIRMVPRKSHTRLMQLFL